ncbi:MobQ family relaxase [Hominenteromicrobium sp.]|uniref:MobQ family relaxase n=1 Tax=Hominenteromicrobium sp. TaxID=3073581 RepID=UPI003AB5487E
MALFHLTVTQTKRSAGQSAVASAAYRSGEKLFSEYYGEYSDYTRKGGVICSDILLPPQAPQEYQDRQTLWNAVEKAERGGNAQLAYSFDIALQNEFSLEENIALARQFLSERFVSRGMICDFAVHQPDREKGGIPNPHFHVLCPIRPLDESGKWGKKQRRVYRLDDDGNRITGKDGKPLFDAVATTDWGDPTTLEEWRKAWCDLCNAKFAEKGLDVRIDHRSYERQGLDLLPTVHEGATVRAMEKKGIRTEKGEFNRWIKATNAVIREVKNRIAALFDWIREAKAELAKPQAPTLVSLLTVYYSQRSAGAYSQKGKTANLKEFNEVFNYLQEHDIFTLDDLEARTAAVSSTVDELKKKLDAQTGRMKEIRQLYEYADTYKSLKPVFDGLQKIKFAKSREKYKAEHAADLRLFYAARRKLTEEFKDGVFDRKKLSAEYSRLEHTHSADYAKFKDIRSELQTLWRVRTNIDTARRFDERTKEQTPQNRPQTRHKKEDISL